MVIQKSHTGREWSGNAIKWCLGHSRVPKCCVIVDFRNLPATFHSKPASYPPTGRAENDQNGRFGAKIQVLALLWANARADLKGLECSKRVGNTINRKITNFYIEAIPKKFSQLRKTIFFFSSSKKCSKFFRPKNFRKMSTPKKIKKFRGQKKSWKLFAIVGFSKDFLIKHNVFIRKPLLKPKNTRKKTGHYFDQARKNIFCRSWEIFLGIASM